MSRPAKAAAILGVGPITHRSLVDPGRLTCRSVPETGYKLLRRDEVEKLAIESTIPARVD